MSLPTIGTLEPHPVRERPDLLAASVHGVLAQWPHASELSVVEIDPELADTEAFCAAYALSLSDSANCVVIGGSRGGEERVAACVVRADRRADVNNLVRKTLDVRKASFLPMAKAVAESGMEYGGITPVGLPDGWRVLVDQASVEIGTAVIGSGLRRSKLVIPGRLLAELPGAEVVENLARAVQPGGED